MKTVCKTNLSPKNILQENGLQNKLTVHKKNLQEYGLQNKPFTKKKGLQNKPFTKKISKKSVYKTNCSPKKHLQKNGLQNTPSTKKNSRKRSTKKALATNVPQENAQHKGLGHKKCGRSNHISDM